MSPRPACNVTLNLPWHYFISFTLHMGIHEDIRSSVWKWKGRKLSSTFSLSIHDSSPRPAPELGLPPRRAEDTSQDSQGSAAVTELWCYSAVTNSWPNWAISSGAMLRGPCPPGSLISKQSTSSHQLGVGLRASCTSNETSRSVQSNCPTQSNTSFEVKTKLLRALLSWVLNILI